MKFKDHLKDRSTLFIIRAVAFFSSLIFLIAFRTRAELIIVLSSIFLSACLIADIADYTRKKNYYNNLYMMLNDLDQKYLLPEMLPEAEFLEGAILKDVLFTCSKSMAENVALYKRRNKEFREYIELWVHEAKLPVATLELIGQNNPEIKNKMKAQIKSLDDYIENVLYYARSENAEKDYIIKEVTLKKAFGNAALKNREALQSADAEIKTDGLDTAVLTDGKWLEFIFGQLIANSLKYRDESRSLCLTVTAECNDHATVLSFKDNGIGIPEEDLPYIFDKSFTGSNGHTNPGSTGMGLYIVKSLCKRLGHSLSVRSEQGSFTELIFTFSKNTHLKMS
ncbi:MAG: sensor histidine kinase [Lachnospiraceae bacterium]|nr:sensor histidine kinase [Lachnospiraceae bacterium]